MKASSATTVIGIVAIVGTIMQLISATIEEGGMPHDPSTWLSFATKIVVGAGLILAKDFNVSNAPAPAAATVVSKADEAKPNPSAVAAKP